MTARAVSDVLEEHHEHIIELFERVSSPDEDRPEILKEILREVSADMAAERTIVVPALRDELDGDEREAVDQLENDFQEIERLLVLIERRKVNSPDMPELVTELKDASLKHIGHLSDLMPALDRSLPEERSAELAENFDSADQALVTHPHPHLLGSGPLSTLAAKLVAHYDRTRDRTVDNRHGK